ncbi:MAG: YidC/Oxa1 family insertase periplasmic-domain containing protein, partial [Candidatus Omnitrophota bacterium]
FKFVEASAQKIVLVYENGVQKIIKEFRVKDDQALEVRIALLDQGKVAEVVDDLNLFNIDSELAQQSREFKKHRSFLELAISLPDKLLRINIDRLNGKTKLPSAESMAWVGFRDRYFCAIFKPDLAIKRLFLSSNGNGRFLGIASNQSNQWQGVLYLGPQDAAALVRYNSGLEQIIHLGAFDGISKIVLKVMWSLFDLTKNWGFAIVLLGTLIFFLLYPLTAKSLKSMREMQKLQPQIELLKRTYSNDAQRLNKEMLELYRANKINPFGGCLPLLLQIPIFFALYQALIRSLALKGSGFLWIKDLSEPDRLLTLPFSIPILGNELNALPLFLTAVMFFQQKMSMKFSAGGDPQQQKIMLVVFPLLFGFMFYHFPSGLALYWVVYSTLSTGFQWLIAQKAAPRN